MSDKHRARKKKPVEPIDWEELERAPNLGGMLSFLNVPPEEAQRRHAAAERLAPLEERAAMMAPGSDTPGATSTAGVSGAEIATEPKRPRLSTPPVSSTPPISNTPPVSSTPAVSESAGLEQPHTSATPPVLNTTLSTAEERPAPFPQPPSDSPPVLNTPAALAAPIVSDAPRRFASRFSEPLAIDAHRPLLPAGGIRTTSEQIAKRFRPLPGAKIARCVLAQDAHTLAEQIIYTALYNSGEGVEPYRDVAVGNRWLMARTGLSERAVQLNLKSLEMKLSIETIQKHDPDSNQPKTYRVYSYDRILERRRAAGLDWIQTKRGGGVRLISAEEALVSNTPPVLNRPPAFPARPVSEAPAGGVSKTPQPPVSQTSHLGNSLGNVLRQPSPSDFAVVVEALRRSAGAADDDAASRLLADCRNRAPDATAAEIAHWVEQSARRITRMREVGNPVGLLLTMVPKCFEGESFRQYREAEQRGREAEAAAEAHYRDLYRRILADPGATNEEKRLAREVLGSSAEGA